MGKYRTFRACGFSLLTLFVVLPFRRTRPVPSVDTARACSTRRGGRDEGPLTLQKVAVTTVEQLERKAKKALGFVQMKGTRRVFRKPLQRISLSVVVERISVSLGHLY